jgi:hypothetical protein
MLIDFRHTFESFRNDFFEKKTALSSKLFYPPEQPIKIIENALNIVDPAEAYLKVLKKCQTDRTKPFDGRIRRHRYTPTPNS